MTVLMLQELDVQLLMMIMNECKEYCLTEQKPKGFFCR